MLDYLINPESNTDLHKIYKIIDSYKERGVTYEEICGEFKKKHRGNKMCTQKVATNCKKIEKQGLIVSTVDNENSMKRVYLTHYYFQKYTDAIHHDLPSS
jgi:hypothetical protein